MPLNNDSFCSTSSTVFSVFESSSCIFSNTSSVSLLKKRSVCVDISSNLLKKLIFSFLYCVQTSLSSHFLGVYASDGIPVLSTFKSNTPNIELPKIK